MGKIERNIDSTLTPVWSAVQNPFVKDVPFEINLSMFGVLQDFWFPNMVSARNESKRIKKTFGFTNRSGFEVIYNIVRKV